MKILITGGAGYIGSHIALDLIEKGNDVVIVDNMTGSNELIIENIKKLTNKKFAFYAYNCVNEHLMNEIFEDNKFELIIHNANKSTNTSDPIEIYDNNINSLLVVTKLMLKHNIDKLIFSSTALAYGDYKQETIAENISKKFAVSPYAVSMQICEDILLSLDNRIKCAILRHFTPIGAHKSGLLGSTNNGLLNSLYKSYKNKSQFIIFGDNYSTNDGTCIRDYIHIDDLVILYSKTVHWLCDSDKTDDFNICTGIGYSIMQIISYFNEAYDCKISVHSGVRRKGDPDRLVGSTEKIKNNFGYVPKTNMLQAIKDSGKWYDYLFDKINYETKSQK